FSSAAHLCMDPLQILIKSGVVDRNALPEIEVELQKPGATLEQVLLKNGVALKEILKARGQYFGIPTREVGEGAVSFDILRYVPEESARHYRFAPIGIAEGALEIGVTDPDNLEARDALSFISAKVG